MKEKPELDVMMDCGCAANSVVKTTEGDKPCCVICSQTKPGDPEYGHRVVPGPDFTNRRSRCVYWGSPLGRRGVCYELVDGVCRCEDPSGTDLPFFESRPKEDYDAYYCGCSCGWD